MREISKLLLISVILFLLVSACASFPSRDRKADSLLVICIRRGAEEAGVSRDREVSRVVFSGPEYVSVRMDKRKTPVHAIVVRSGVYRLESLELKNGEVIPVSINTVALVSPDTVALYPRLLPEGLGADVRAINELPALRPEDQREASLLVQTIFNTGRCTTSCSSRSV